MKEGPEKEQAKKISYTRDYLLSFRDKPECQSVPETIRSFLEIQKVQTNPQTNPSSKKFKIAK